MLSPGESAQRSRQRDTCSRAPLESECDPCPLDVFHYFNASAPAAARGRGCGRGEATEHALHSDLDVRGRLSAGEGWLDNCSPHVDRGVAHLILAAPTAGLVLREQGTAGAEGSWCAVPSGVPLGAERHPKCLAPGARRSLLSQIPVNLFRSTRHSTAELFDARLQYY